MQYRVKVRQTRVVEFKVDADGWGAAREAALEKVDRGRLVRSPRGWDCSVVGVKQLGEPWVTVERSQGDALTFKRAVGNRFTAADVLLLRARLGAAGLRPLEDWNGVGHNTLSVRLLGLEGSSSLTLDQLALLEAPRTKRGGR